MGQKRLTEGLNVKKRRLMNAMNGRRPGNGIEGARTEDREDDGVWNWCWCWNIAGAARRRESFRELSMVADDSSAIAMAPQDLDAGRIFWIVCTLL